MDNGKVIHQRSDDQEISAIGVLKEKDLNHAILFGRPNGTIGIVNSNGICHEWDGTLDTGSLFTSTTNKESVDNVVCDPRGLNVKSNAGKNMNARGKMPGLNTKVWTDKTGVVNAFSFVDKSCQN